MTSDATNPRRSRSPGSATVGKLHQIDWGQKLSVIEQQMYENALEQMTRRMEKRLSEYRQKLKTPGQQLDEEQWKAFLSKLARAELSFVQKFWPQIEDRLR